MIQESAGTDVPFVSRSGHSGRARLPAEIRSRWNACKIFHRAFIAFWVDYPLMTTRRQSRRFLRRLGTGLNRPGTILADGVFPIVSYWLLDD